MAINLSCSCSPVEGEVNVKLIDHSVVIECLKCGAMKRFKANDVISEVSE